MLTRTQKNVSRKQRIDVEKRDKILVLINHIRRNRPRNYLAKYATVVNHAQYGSSVTWACHLRM